MKMTINGMEHTASTVMVFQTADYNKFGMIKGNRSLDMNKIKRILADIDRGTNLLKYCPILVVEMGGKLDVIDGQHRFAVAKKIKSPVYYIIADNLSLYDIARMNSNTEKWKQVDFINCYKELGNKHYIQLEQLLKTHQGLTITTAVNLMMFGKVHSSGSSSGAATKFQRGEFEVKQQAHTDGFLKHIEAFDYKNRYSAAFMVAIEKVIGAGVYPVEELVAKVNAAGSLEKQPHWRKYLTAMEEIVSKGKQKRVAIY